VALGGNQPFASLDGPQLLQKALDALEAQGLGVLSCSSAWRTPAWPDPSEPAYTNAAAVLAADGLAPEEVLARLLAVEQRFGRERRTRWAARTLDLDLLDMDGRMLASPELTLPHPRLCERAFVLAPLAEAAPWWRHPGDGRSAAQMLQLLSPGGQQWLGALR
jgi:2-amino-4-hydroxy-6-hydroxymethyldihydropteridine diphosphokinase